MDGKKYPLYSTGYCPSGAAALFTIGKSEEEKQGKGTADHILTMVDWFTNFTSISERDTQTGDIRPIRRTLINSTDPGGVADGIWWKWQGDVRPWEYYPTSISQAIEEFYQAITQRRNGGVTTLDLQIHCLR